MPISIVVSSIVEVSLNKVAFYILVGADDWTAKRAIIASNEKEKALLFTPMKASLEAI